MKNSRGPLPSAIVTGPTSGIGRCVAKSLAELGWCVILACRNLEKGKLVCEDVNKHLETNGLSGCAEVGPRLDLGSLKSIHEFARLLGTRPVKLLVNNAGTNNEEWVTPEGVPALCQVNYVGPFLLTRLLVPNLVKARPSRVVNVSSVMHRLGDVHEPRHMLEDPYYGTYRNAKLAIVLFTHELQRRLINHGVDCHAVDPGAVNTGIFSGSLWSMFPFNRVLDVCYAPSEDGSKTVVFASTVKPLVPIACSPAEIEVDTKRSDIRGLFFARGLFASHFVTRPWESQGLLAWLAVLAQKTVMVIFSLADYPIRKLSGNRLQSCVRSVPSSNQSYDTRIALQLWNLTSDLVGLPRSI